MRNCNIFVALIILLFSIILNAQQKDFKEIITAQDVIDNYLISNGGKENLDTIKSVKQTGSLSVMGMEMPVTVYVSNEYLYMNMENPTFGVIIAYNNKDKKGWTKMMGQLTDMSDEEIKKYSETLESSLWRYYLYKDKYIISYELMQNERVDDKNSYVVNFKKGDSLIYTVYFDTANYNRVKQVKEGFSSFYDDFREVGNSGIIMPYLITQQGTIKVTKYEFNTEFDKNLLNKSFKKEE